MNYGTLKTTVLSYAHRPDLSAEVAGFVRLAEGMIRRELLASTYSVTLAEADRVSGGTYTLPSTAVEVRSLANDDGPLDQISVAQLSRFSTSGEPHSFAVLGSTIKIVGAPETDSEFTLEYFGHPAAFSLDADVNDLLTNHEALYIYGALFYLYQFTQDVELAQGALDTYNDVLAKLNEQASRKLAGGSIAGSYNLYGGSPSY